jgi:adenine C2-methylase RlmN of 23S rRNA A2503 and tRNA A37
VGDVICVSTYVYFEMKCKFCATCDVGSSLAPQSVEMIGEARMEDVNSRDEQYIVVSASPRGLGW